MAADKDGSHVIMKIADYQSEVCGHMEGSGRSTYEQLGPPSESELSKWTDFATKAEMVLRTKLQQTCPESLKPTIDMFLEHSSRVSVPRFYLLAKTKLDFTSAMMAVGFHAPSQVCTVLSLLQALP